ncbi:hypothetical protein OGR47_09680 [Methylocystis sp. MJC1]|uniref:hypothetical protein n=1 Tax=Methylocystis sp. MJC1 TaxID=2654282 RepID=UPI0013EC9DD6|nr:hypothetical protein [Methylocystis sp. MJC1]KAF2992117.1 hypothetical protein MJC1_00489 [Methylocystis sp. MJC1]MBU6527258.1 hypothetical protein [Methylocystis sp. MJC1]UZX10216.1 hypothetical protein OGR47_09680 [Methylocystis sp. MJC1]
MFDAISRRLIGVLIPISLAALASPAQAGPAQAATPPSTPFDGRWVIEATTSSFFCPVKRKQLVAIVHGGQVTKLVGIPASTSGQIGADGGVSINLKVFSVTAAIHGKMLDKSGAGDWSTNSMLCARGAWRAAHAGN